MRFFHDMDQNPFLAAGLLTGLLASLACGLIGPYVVTRRIVFLSGSVAHIALGGIGGAIFLANTYPDTLGWLNPLHGAVVVALGAAVLIAVVHDRVAERMDTLIGALWAIGMAAGVLLIKLTPGYHTELMSYLFGNIVYFNWQQLGMMAVVDALIVVTVLICHKRLMAICFDPQHTQLQGVSVLGTNAVLLSLVALTVICLIQMVGLILVIALLTLPAATAAHYVTRMAPMMWVSIGLCATITTIPRVAVYGTPISPEAAIVLAAGGFYLLSVGYTRAWKKNQSHKIGKLN